MKQRHCYCPEDGSHPRYLRKDGIPPEYCGKCQVCGQPGHTRPHPACLPYTGAWCDRHYDLIDQSAEAAIGQFEYGLNPVDLQWYRTPGRRRRRFGIVPYVEDTALMEFRSDWLARCISLTPHGDIRTRYERGIHPLWLWMHPFQIMQEMDPTVQWLPVTQDEFEQIWRRGDAG